jgi:hypothetical protein
VTLTNIAQSRKEAPGLYTRGFLMVTLCSDAALVTQGAAALVRAFRERIQP